MTRGTTEQAHSMTLAELYAVAHRMEADAGERYAWLAEQMDVHNNAELSAIFRDLARAENLHRDEIGRMAGEDIDLEAAAGRITRWEGGESPEVADLAVAHYLMTPRSALEMALAAEERAVEFYDGLLAELVDADTRRVAEALLEEEIGHVELCHRLLRRYSDPHSRSAEDPDPPVSQD